MSDETNLLDDDNNPELSIVEVDSELARKEYRAALIEVDADKTEMGALIDSVEKAVPEIVKWKERGSLVRLEMPAGFNKQELLKGRGYARKLACQGKDGQFVGTASINTLGKAGTIANVFGIASYVVGQQQMAEMNKRLDSIEETIGEIRSFLDKQQRAQITGAYKVMRRYLGRVGEYSDNPELLAAPQNEIERIHNESLTMWESLMGEMKSFAGSLVVEGSLQGKRKPKRIDEGAVEEKMSRLAHLDGKADAVLQIAYLSSELKSRFNPQYASSLFQEDLEEVAKMCSGYVVERQRALDGLDEMCKRVRSRIPIAIAEDRECRQISEGPAPVKKAYTALQAIGRKTGKINPVRMRRARLERDEETRRWLERGIIKQRKHSVGVNEADVNRFSSENELQDESFDLLYDWHSNKIYLVPKDDNTHGSNSDSR